MRRNVSWRDRLWLYGALVFFVIGLSLLVQFFALSRQGQSIPAGNAALLTVVSLASFMIALAFLLNYRESMQRAREEIMRSYVQRLRNYSVGNIEAIREFIDALSADHIELPLAQVPEMPEDETRPLKTRERDSLLRIIYGMATAKPYSFDPSATRSEVAATIASATDAAGCSVDPDTVRKYLRQAADRFGKSSLASR